MTTKKFVSRLKKILIATTDYVVDGLFNMKDIKNDTYAAGFDDIIVLTGEDENDVFTLTIKKIKS